LPNIILSGSLSTNDEEFKIFGVSNDKKNQSRLSKKVCTNVLICLPFILFYMSVILLLWQFGFDKIGKRRKTRPQSSCLDFFEILIKNGE
jgi:hypothetical protein